MHTVYIMLLSLILAHSVHASTYTVNHNGDAPDATHGDDVCATSGSVCTFRAAIEEANNHDGLDTIVMDGGAPYVIAPASLLPDLQGPLIVDALGCSGTCGTTYRIEIQGSTSLSRALLLAGAVTVRGVKITGTFGAPSSAILVGGIGSVIDCASINATASVGINITSDAARAQVLNSSIIGVPSGDCLQANATTAVLIQGNTITGCEDGVYLSDASGHVLYNLTSDQAHNGIHIDNGSDGVVVRGNRSGTSADGMSADGNEHEGLRINDSDNVQVGGALAGQRNMLSSNTRNGLWILGTSDGTHVEGNYLGLNASATPSLCNGVGNIRDDGTNTTDSNNLKCPTPTPFPNGCCAVDGGGGVTCLDAAVLQTAVTSQSQCQAALDAFLGSGVATAQSFNSGAVCQGVSTPGTGTCP